MKGFTKDVLFGVAAMLTTAGLLHVFNLVSWSVFWTDWRIAGKFIFIITIVYMLGWVDGKIFGN